jgi:AcrR family transcriptional regulator
MSTPVARLSERLADHTQALILASAIELLETSSVSELTVRAVAARAGISERTVFRYFADRDAFLDAVAGAVTERMELPRSPSTMEELLRYPDMLYRRFEAVAPLVRAALHTELFDRLRNAQAKHRWVAVRALIDAHAPRRPERDREIAAANIRYHLSASTWHYYRSYFGLSLELTIACGETAVRQAVEGLVAKARR